MKKNQKFVLVWCVVVLMTMVLSGCAKEENSASVRVGSLKGPTSIGLVELMERAENNETDNEYTFTMETGADALLTQMVQGNLDIALLPANVASVLYNKTEGDIVAIDINTLGVLYMLSADDSIKNIQDLKGKTIYLTGKGTTPDYVLQYLLEENQIRLDEVKLEYKSEATEVAAILKSDEKAIGLLPQPFVTAAMTQNEALQIVFDMNELWQALQGENSSQVTGVTVVRREFLKQHEGAVKSFLKDHKQSADYVMEHVDKAAEFVVKTGIIEKEPIAKKAIPNCNITYIDGKEMEKALSGYLNVLYEKDASFVGGTLPKEDFYYVGK